MNLSLLDMEGYGAVVVSQFTLLADTRKGRRPSYSHAAEPGKALDYYKALIKHLSDEGIHVESGVFQSHMDISYTNDGPVTILMDSKKMF